jgi:ketosteroid isomerase-like protein
MPADAFEAGMRLMDDELAALKACIEPRMIGAAPTEIVEALYEAFRRRDLTTIFGLLSPDVEIVQSDQLPWGGCYHGHEGARRFFAQLGSHIDSTVAIDRMIDSGDHVAATIRRCSKPLRREKNNYDYCD